MSTLIPSVLALYSCRTLGELWHAIGDVPYDTPLSMSLSKRLQTVRDLHETLEPLGMSDDTPLFMDPEATAEVQVAWRGPRILAVEIRPEAAAA